MFTLKDSASSDKMLQNAFFFFRYVATQHNRERSGSVVECLTRDGGAPGSSIIGVTALWSLSKTQLS